MSTTISTTTNLRFFLRFLFLGILPSLLAPVTVGLGCGGGAGPITQAEFCAQKATKECDGVAMACLSDPAACKTKRVAACEEFAEAQQAPPSSAVLRPFRPDKANACISKAAEVYNKALITPEDRAALDDVCARVFSAQRNDATCNNDYECDVNQVCDALFNTCAKKKSVAADDFCNNPGDVCPAAQFCNTAVPRKCVPRLTVNMACDPTNPCAESLTCAAGVCAAGATNGKPCTADSDCATASPYCDPYNGNLCTSGFRPSTGSKECVVAFGGADTTGGTGGASGGAGGAGGAN
jgi:hypothetical protein